MDPTATPASTAPNRGCPRAAMLRAWVASRRKAMPTEEELLLKRRYREQLDRQRARARKAAQAEEAERAERVAKREREALLAAGWDESRNGELTDDSLTSGTFLLKQQNSCGSVQQSASGARKSSKVPTPRSFGELPRPILSVIFNFVAIVEPRLFDDVAQLMDALATDDAMLVHEPPAEVDRLLGCVDAAFEEHVRAFGDSSLAGLPLHVDRRLDPTSNSDEGHASTIIGRLTFHEQRDAYRRRLAVVHREVQHLRVRQTQVASWNAFRDTILDQPCAEIRETVRGDFNRWGSILGDWFMQRGDVVVHLIGAEFKALNERVRAVEFIGDPELELEDARNLFWEVDRTVPEGVSEEYLRSVTFKQAITLGIADVHWVRGYTWQERPLDETARETLAESAIASKIMNASSAAVGASAMSLDLRTAEEKLAEEEESRAAAAAEEERRREEAEAAAQRKNRFDRARDVAATGMTQRVWKQTELRVPRSRHQFGGCELCASVPVHHVGLAKPNSGADGDIVLCQGCYAAEYESVPVLAKMYGWARVDDLINRDGEFAEFRIPETTAPAAPAAAEPAAAEPAGAEPGAALATDHGLVATAD